jgi:hypothetical protein
MDAKTSEWEGCVRLDRDHLRDWFGAKAGIIDPGYLCKRVWPGVSYGNAFAYLFRRFGESAPFDNYKQLCNYDLSTPDPEVGFWLSCGASSVGMDPGYWLSPELGRAIAKQDRYGGYDDWDWVVPGNSYEGRIPPAGTPAGRAIEAIEAGMRDLLRPVEIRDVAVNILGPYKGDLESVPSAWKD